MQSSPVDRRDVLILVGSLIGATAISSPLRAASAPGFYTSTELSFLAELAETIIPKTDTPGAKAVNVHGILDTMMTDWASAETRERYQSLLSDMEADLKELAGKPFVEADPDARAKALSAYDTHAFANISDQSNTYRDLKQLIAALYYLSEPGASEELRYERFPGRWAPCISFDEIGRNWAEG